MAHPACSNQLINHLTLDVMHALLAQCEWVQLAAKTTLDATHYASGYAYFPAGAMIASVMPEPPTKSVAIGFVGEEGCWGVASILGVNDPQSQAVVQSAGWALKIPNLALHQLMRSYPSIHQQLLTYLAVIHAQLAQAVVCHHFHFLPQRLARLLLTLQDRLHVSPFFMTQDLLAHFLGVRRVGVTKAARDFHLQKIVTYSRGYIKINNIVALRRIACPCYAIDQATYQSLMHF